MSLHRNMAVAMKVCELACLILSILVLQAVNTSQSGNRNNPLDNGRKVRFLQPGSRVRVLPCETSDRQLHIYCYHGRPKQIINLWQTALLQLDVSSDKYDLYDGASPNEVLEEYEQHRSSWAINLFSWKHKTIKLNPFNQSCIGIYSSEGHEVHLNIIRIDYWRVLLQCAGVLLFISAHKLSKNSLFYYISGITVGICASFLILVYVISRLLPKRPVMYGFVIGGWTVGIYFLHLMWENLRLIIMQYQNYALFYIVFTGLISFVVCYRFGPVTDQRSKNLIKWALQGASLGMIFFSSHFQEATAAIIIIILVVYNFPAAWTSKLLVYWKRQFPPKMKLMTEDEYYDQGVRETAKALDELRGYCSSPDCNAWKTMLKLKEPVRFAKFMDGISHLSDDEVLAYESEGRQTLTEYYTDDDSESGSEY